MAKKKLNNLSDLGMVYSTDPNFSFEEEKEEIITLAPKEQQLRLQLETKHRGGKTASIVFGFIGKDEDLEILGKKLKTHCGTGGSVKDGEIIIQGDHREKIRQWLTKEGYKVKG